MQLVFKVVTENTSFFLPSLLSPSLLLSSACPFKLFCSPSLVSKPSAQVDDDDDDDAEHVVLDADDDDDIYLTLRGSCEQVVLRAMCSMFYLHEYPHLCLLGHLLSYQLSYHVWMETL